MGSVEGTGNAMPRGWIGWLARRPAGVLARSLTAAAILAGTAAAAPSREELETDRDSFTFAPTTTGRDTSILEASYSFIDNRLAPETHSVPEVLLRRGISDTVEARLGFNYEAGGPAARSGGVQNPPERFRGPRIAPRSRDVP